MKSIIQKWGNSQAIRLPKTILELAHFKENEAVQLVVDEDKIIIQKVFANRHKTIQERFEGFTGEYSPEEIDWGEPVGREIW